MVDMSNAVLAMAEAEGPTSVLTQVLAPLLELDEVQLARVWFMEDQDCPICAQSRRAPSPGALHLRASGGPGDTEAEIGGVSHLIEPGTSSELSSIAATGAPRFAGSEQLARWGLPSEHPAGLAIRGVVGYPLLFRRRVVGVLVCYLRTEARGDSLPWLPAFAAHAAVAIGNCRSLQEISQLREQLEQERDYLREEAALTVPVDGIVGQSAALARLLRQVSLVAPTEANVLIQGESGTGKELIARAIHHRSPRSAQPLIKVNCASLPRELFESELFGHVRGAFTGAIHDRVGRFQLADRGTLFLDEVGEIPPDLQTKLLRVLQEGEFERVGEDVTRRVNVRVIAATNRDLRADVDAGQFRLDVFYRLSVFPITVPALRERREDIPLLVASFLRTSSQHLRRAAPKVTQRELAKLMTYDWPGNIRELQHVVERAVIVAPPGGRIRFDVNSAPPAAPASKEPERPYQTQKEWRRSERENLLAALKAAGWKVSGANGAAALLGINPNTLASRLRALGLKKAFTT
jgi:transcriptional regulator with GAF, ATPase, and Fis domain